MSKKSANLLKFSTPASWWGEKWREGLYSGNGKIGANVYGGAAAEKILINDKNLAWLGRTSVVPDISTKSKEVKRRMENGDYMEGQEVFLKALASKNFRPQPNYPLPLCALNVHFQNLGLVTNFKRQLNMENGEVSVSYSSGGTKYSRDLFVSRHNNFVVYSITKTGAVPITADFSFALMEEINAHTPEGNVAMPEGVALHFDKQCFGISARNDEDGTDFGAVAKIVTNGGTVRVENNVVRVTNANSVFIIVETFTGANASGEWQRLKTKLLGVKENYDRMLKNHSQLHSKLFLTTDVELDENDADIEELLADAQAGNLRPILIEKLYKFGRYLYVSDNDGLGSAPTPTGLWNGSYKAMRAFNSVGGELQMSVLHTLAGNLAIDTEKMFDGFYQYLGDYQNNAMRIFGCRGAFVPAVASPNTGRLGSNDIFAVHFTGAGAWLCNFFFRYATQYQNTKFLKSKLLPFMKEVALFYEDFLNERENQLVVNPSPLPIRIDEGERITERPVVAKNSQQDYDLIKDFFENLIEASKVVGSNKRDVEKWSQILAKIPEKQLSSDNTIKEFVNSSISVDYSGVSIGTLYPAYFSHDINFLSAPDEIELYEKTADAKMQNADLQNSFYMAVLSNVYARLGNSFKAKQSLLSIVRGASMNNLVMVDKDWRDMGICGNAVWTPVQLQTNYAIVNAIQEMLLYSHKNIISILPSLPSDIKEPAFSRLVAENGVEVSVKTTTDKGGVLTVSLHSKTDQLIDLYLPMAVKKVIKQNKNDTTKLTTATAVEKSIKGLFLPANKTVTINFKCLF